MGQVEDIIDGRRSFRALEPLALTKEEFRKLANQLTESARLAPSADNRQPWRFVSVYEEPQLSAMRKALSPLNQWASACDMFIVVCASPTTSVSGPSDSGKNGPINYYLYDTGLASAFLMLRATDFSLVAHPMAGFDDGAVAAAIALDQAVDPELQVVTQLQIVALMAIGKKSNNAAVFNRLPEDLQKMELKRPPRKPLEHIAFHNTFGGGAVKAKPVDKEKPTFDRDVILINDDGRIYHLDQATLTALISVDEMTAEEQVPYGFIKELKDLGISVAAIPNPPEAAADPNAAIFCYLLNLGSLIPPKPPQQATPPRPAAGVQPRDVVTTSAVDTPRRRVVVRKLPNIQYSGCRKE
jgi:nitroreductase